MDIQIDHYVAKFASFGGSNELFGKAICFPRDWDDWGN